MGLPLVSIASAGYRLYSTAEKTGIVGWEDVVIAFGKILPKMYLRAHKNDRSALDEMVEAAKGAVPDRTGALLNGITGEVEDDTCIFRASAISPDGKHEDYAKDVEFGHHAGGHAVADDDYFATSGGASFGGGSDIAPAPFFFPAANAAFKKRGVSMDSVISGVAAEDGWQTA